MNTIDEKENYNKKCPCCKSIRDVDLFIENNKIYINCFYCRIAIKECNSDRRNSIKQFNKNNKEINICRNCYNEYPIISFINDKGKITVCCESCRFTINQNNKNKTIEKNKKIQESKTTEKILDNTKKCSRCKKYKDNNSYINEKNVIVKSCFDCRQKDKQLIIEKNKLKPIIADKTCINCNFIGDKSLFCKDSSLCKKCYKVYNKEYKKNNLPNQLDPNIIKICKKCNFEGGSDLFAPFEFICKKCKNLRSRENHKKNKDKDNANTKIYYQTHKVQILETNVKNKEKRNSANRKRQKERLKTDPVFRLRKNVTRAIIYYLKKNNSSKNNNSCLQFLPFTIEELKLYIESLFEPWMNWDNQGKYDLKTWNDNDSSTWTWQLDHIIPQSKLPYISMEEENFKLCWSLSNLRPYSSKQNILDGDRR